MTEFHKKDIEPLDFIVKRTLETGFAVNANDLIEAGFISLKDERGYAIVAANFEVSKEFERFLYILDKNKICKCFFDEDAQRAARNSYTLQFQKQGGFKSLYKSLKDKYELDERKNYLEMKNLELQKENFEHLKLIRNKEERIRNLTSENLKLGNWDIKFRWFIVAISFIFGLITKYFFDS